MFSKVQQNGKQGTTITSELFGTELDNQKQAEVAALSVQSGLQDSKAASKLGEHSMGDTNSLQAQQEVESVDIEDVENKTSDADDQSPKESLPVSQHIFPEGDAVFVSDPQTHAVYGDSERAVNSILVSATKVGAVSKQLWSDIADEEDEYHKNQFEQLQVLPSVAASDQQQLTSSKIESLSKEPQTGPEIDHSAPEKQGPGTKQLLPEIVQKETEIQQNDIDEVLAGRGHFEEMNIGNKSPLDFETKLFISNLPFKVTIADVKELFSSVGNLKRCTLHYDRSGRSEGKAEVVFSCAQDATAAAKRFHNVELDGIPMKIQIVRYNTSNLVTHKEALTPSAYRTRQGRGQGRDRGRRRGRRN